VHDWCGLVGQGRDERRDAAMSQHAMAIGMPKSSGVRPSDMQTLIDKLTTSLGAIP
jgi:hypothetical protein